MLRSGQYTSVQHGVMMSPPVPNLSSLIQLIILQLGMDVSHYAKWSTGRMRGASDGKADIRLSLVRK